MNERTPEQSAVVTTYMVLPPHTNVQGTAFGGMIMQWMDITAAVAANRHCGHAAVTVAVDDLVFARPIRMGDIVVLRACVNYAGQTSLEVGVRVEREHVATRELEHCLSGYFTFVGVDSGGKSVTVPRVVPRTDVERRRYLAAELRRARRLEARTAG